jgi:tetratricopeptide (TPR) repeat protein
VEERRELWIALAWRLVFAAPFAVAAGLLFASGGGPDMAGRRVLALAFIVLYAIIVAPGFAALIAEPAGSLFYPRRIALPQPCRSIAQAKRARGDYRAALAAYEEVLAEFPADLESWTAMVEIACVQLGDRALAEALARRALSALTQEGDRMELIRVHRRSTERLRATLIASV